MRKPPDPHWLICLAIIAVATVGKFGGTLFAARWQGISWHDAAVVGVLMNTRGLMELVVLTIGSTCRSSRPRCLP
ncbi:MAG: cation:proton antiporter [Pirellulales bacterium]